MTSADAAALHERLFTIDTHFDTPTTQFGKPGWNFGAGHEVLADGSQCDLPRMRRGGLDAAVFAVYVMQAGRTRAAWTAARHLAHRHFDAIAAVLPQHATECALVRTVAEAQRAKRDGLRAIFLSIENAYSLGADPAAVSEYHARGLRMLGLTHMLNNEIADASTDPRGREWGGLSGLGREVVAECNRLGVVLDASHASDETLRDLLERSRAPVMLSHSDCRAHCDHPRNVDDGLLRDLAEQGGVIQINALPITLVEAPGNRRTATIAEVLLQFAGEVLTPEVLSAADKAYSSVARAHPNPPSTLDDFIRHLEHAVEVAGIDHVGIGCDFDGGGGVDGLKDASAYPNLTFTLLARGWSEADLGKLWGENTLRVLRASEMVACGRSQP
jgi:membrane dipeptidase